VYELKLLNGGNVLLFVITSNLLKRWYAHVTRRKL